MARLPFCLCATGVVRGSTLFSGVPMEADESVAVTRLPGDLGLARSHCIQQHF